MSFRRGNIVGCTHLVFFIVLLVMARVALMRVRYQRQLQTLAYINERIELERLVIDHFCFEEEDFTYEDDKYEVFAQKNDEKINVLVNGVRSYRFSYDIIDDGSFNLTKMEE
ncbi:hypothetical protein [Erysipelothrix tonsillarum]|uniref:hypothetical protein n=1 Tax=Erysipelothrix tonsillarum TaxID=38402 RepID=UPI00036324DD|nr:hypothetical protein [Erysipelothrix tonsillarum]